MQSNFISSQHSSPEYLQFKKVCIITLIVYFICSIFGWINLFISSINHKIYYPLRSYLILFNKNDIKNLEKVGESILNFSGFKAIINTNVPYEFINEVFFLVISISLMVLFYKGYKLASSEKIESLDIIKWAVIFSILMTIAIPCNSSDLYGYISRGAQQTLYHQNPYFETVAEIKNFKKDPLFSNFMWPHQPTTYGPIFISTSKTILHLSNNDFLISFFNFKLLNLIVYSFLLVFAIKKLKSKDFFLLSCNPLILIQGLWNCHNDLICGVLIFFGLYIISKENKYFLGALALTSVIGIKYVSVLILPVIFIHLMLKDKKKLGDFFLGILCGLIVVGIFSIEYINIPDTVSTEKIHRLYTNIDLVHKSFIATIFILIKYLSKALSLNLDFKVLLSILKLVVYGAFLIFYINIILKKDEEITSKVFIVLLAFFCFTIGKFHSWYLLNFIFLLPLLNSDKSKFIIKFSILLIMFHTLSITFLDQAKILNFTILTLLPLILTYKSRQKLSG